MAEFLFKRNQMPAGQIDTLLDLWAAKVLKHGGIAPFASHSDMYETIDSAKHGNIEWQCLKLKYEDVIPPGNAPTWMVDEFEVWYRNPREVMKSMLANTDFAGEIDVAPLREYDEEENREYKNFMSGDWAWKQAVSYFLLVFT